MPKLEPGMLCRVVSTHPANNGKIITTVKYVGTPPVPGPNGCGVWLQSRFWEVDTPLLITGNGKTEHLPYAPESVLEPIKRDDTPADEGFQQELKQLLGRKHAQNT